MKESEIENIELYKVDISGEITKIEQSDGEIRISIGTDRQVWIEDSHEQDCCEHVYADWSAIKNSIDDIVGTNVDEIVIKGVPEMGILLVFGVGKKVFIPCYNEQNGYYSDSLSLRVRHSGKDVEFSVTKFVKYNEY